MEMYSKCGLVCNAHECASFSRIAIVYVFVNQLFHVVLDSIVVSISACHAEDPGSIPGRGAPFLYFLHLPSKLWSLV